MHTINVKTATRESAEQFKTDKFQRYCVTDGDERLDFIPALFEDINSILLFWCYTEKLDKITLLMYDKKLRAESMRK